MRFTDENIRQLAPNEVFVFGSNYAGRHGKGAARLALRFGARPGLGMGAAGQTYAIATKGHRLEVLSLAAISVQVFRFLRYAGAHPGQTFLVTRIGCGLAGYHAKEIAPLFFQAGRPPANVVLPQDFWGHAPPGLGPATT